MEDKFKDPIPNPNNIFTNTIEEVYDEKFGRKKYIVKKVLKEEPEENDKKDQKKGSTIQETIFLQKRTEDLKLDKNIGKVYTVAKDSQKQEHGGFYCQLCDTHVWDSNAWLDHLNGKKHLRLLGMNNKVMKVELSSVQQKLQKLKGQGKIQIDELEELQKEEEEKKLRKKLKKNNEEELQTNEEELNLQINKQQNNSQTQSNNNQNNNQASENKEEQNNQDEEELDEDQLLMQQMGLPTQFFSKKQKR